MDSNANITLLKGSKLEKEKSHNLHLKHLKIKGGCCLSLFIFFCLLITVSIEVIITLHMPPLQNEQVDSISTETQHHIMLPMHATNDTNIVQNIKQVQYISVPTTESTVMILILVSFILFFITMLPYKQTNALPFLYMCC